MFLTNLLDKITTHISFSKHFSVARSFYKTMWKIFCTAGRSADNNTLGRMRFGYRIKWIKTHTQGIRITQYLWFF